MKTVEITYAKLGIEMEFAEHGDLVSARVHGHDISDSGDALNHALVTVIEAGHNIHADISQAFDLKYPGHVNERVRSSI